jgi:hypothetical protein
MRWPWRGVALSRWENRGRFFFGERAAQRYEKRRNFRAKTIFVWTINDVPHLTER